MTTTTHTPTPWMIDGSPIELYLTPSDGEQKIIARWLLRDDDAARANAAHIVRCVNAHDAFVAVLRRICDDIATISEASRIARAALRDAGIAESGVAE